jgi:hypothetical protein
MCIEVHGRVKIKVNTKINGIFTGDEKLADEGRPWDVTLEITLTRPSIFNPQN